jgi:ABC-2 type transport system ATP-binding protein
MKKKLGLLLALLHQPKLLILDEPTNELDVESTHLFYCLIEAQSKAGVTVLFSTHLMDHVTRLCSHAIVINRGAVVGCVQPNRTVLILLTRQDRFRSGE